MSFCSADQSKVKRIFPCDFCHKLFTTKGNMCEHRRTHTGEKPFVCKYCGKAFAQSSTHSKHQLVHRNKKMKNSCKEHPVQKPSQEQSVSESGLPILSASSVSQLQESPSLTSKKRFGDSLNVDRQSSVKTETKYFDNSDWHNSNSVFDRQDDMSLKIDSVHGSVITPTAVASFDDTAKDNGQTSSADAIPVITGMFKNRACEFTPLSEDRNLQIKTEDLNGKGINLGSSSSLTEPNSSERKNLSFQHKESKSFENSHFIIEEATTIHSKDKEFHSSVSQPFPSKQFGHDEMVTWNSHLQDNSIIQLDLTLDDDDDGDTAPVTEEKFQNNTETFFKCIHCSETFSSLEEHICLAKEAKMFFKCQVCQKTFAQYGLFVRHKKTHENSHEFQSSSYETIRYKTCDNSVSVDIRNESGKVSEITNSLHLRGRRKANCTVDLLTSSFPTKSNQMLHSDTLQLEQKESSDDVIIIEEDSTPDEDSDKNVWGKNAREISREKHSAVSAYSNTEQFNNNIQGIYSERSNLLANVDVNKPLKRALDSRLTPAPKPDVVQSKNNLSSLEKRPVPFKKAPQQIGAKGYPFTCLFCPRKFSTASNMREHMRTHTGEKPFTCEICQKKFAQASTRSKHMQTHVGYKMSGLSGKKLMHIQTLRKQLRKTVNNPKKNFLPNTTGTSSKATLRANSSKSLSTKTVYLKNSSNLPNSKISQVNLRQHGVAMQPGTSSKFLIPSKTISNKFLSLNTTSSWRTESNNEKSFSYKMGDRNQMNVSQKKMDCAIVQANTRNIDNKVHLPLAPPSDSQISVLGSSFENSSPKMNCFASTTNMTTTTTTTLPHVKLRHKGAHRYLRNAKSYRPFRCMYCPRTFSTSGNMKEHMRTHTGEKPFRCEYCHRRFAQSSTHSKHVLIHVRKQQLNCFLCGKLFSQVALLRSHIVNDHKTSKNPTTKYQSIDKPSKLTLTNKSEDSSSLASKGQAVNFLDSFSKNQSSQEARIERNEIITTSKSGSELTTSLGEKTLSEVDLSSHRTHFLIHKNSESFLSVQKKKERKVPPQNSAEVLKIGNKPEDNLNICVEDSLVSKSNFPGALTDSACITRKLNSQVLDEMGTKCLKTSLSPQHQQQSQTKRDSIPVFALTQIKDNNLELTSVIKSESSKSVDKNTYSIVKMEPLDNPSLDDVEMLTRISFNTEEERLNNCTNLEEQTTSSDFHVDRTYEQNQLIKSSDVEILHVSIDNKEENLPHLQLSSAQNERSFVIYNQTLTNSEVDLQTRTIVDIDMNNEYDKKMVNMSDIFLDREQNIYQQKVSSCFPNSNRSSPSSNLSFPVLAANNNSIDHLSLKTESNTTRGNETFDSLNEEQENKTYILSEVPTCEQSFKMANHVSLDLKDDISEPQVTEQNLAPFLNSEHSLNSCNGNSSFKNLNPFLEMAPETKSKRKEIASTFTENGNSRILGTTPQNSLQEESVVLVNNIKLEKTVSDEFSFEEDKLKYVVNPDINQVFRTESPQLNSDLNQAMSISDPMVSHLELKVSEIVANVPYPFTSQVNRLQQIADNSLSCDQIDTFDASVKVTVSDTNLARTHSSESQSVCTGAENQQPSHDGTLLNISSTPKSSNYLERKRKQQQQQQQKTAGRFKCLYCNRLFSSQSNMREHMRTHTGEKPFECVFCLRRFAQSSTHSKHVQTHLRFRQLVCPQCGKRFLQANHLYRHIKTQHKSSANSDPKKPAFPLDSATLATEKAFHCVKQTARNKKKCLVNLSENVQATFTVHNTSTELSNDRPEILNELISLKYEQTKSTIDIDLEKADSNLSSPIEPCISPLDVNIKTISLNQSDFCLNTPPNYSPKNIDKLPFLSSDQVSPSDQILDTVINPQKTNDTNVNKKLSECHIYQVDLPQNKVTCKNNNQPSDGDESNSFSVSNFGKNLLGIQIETELSNRPVANKEFSSNTQRVKISSEKDDDNPCHSVYSPSFSDLALTNISSSSSSLPPTSSILPLPPTFSITTTLNSSLPSLSISSLPTPPSLTPTSAFLPSLPPFPSHVGPSSLASSPTTSSVPPSCSSLSLLPPPTLSTLPSSPSLSLLSSSALPHSSPFPLPSPSTSPAPPPSSSLPVLSSSSSSIVCIEHNKINSLQHFHRCLFCSKMSLALINLKEHLRSSMDDEEEGKEKLLLNLKNMPTHKEYITWYKHIEILLRFKPQLHDQKFDGKTQHVKIMFDVGDRLRHSRYKCKQCSKQCTTFLSLLFHRHVHSKRLTPRKLTKRTCFLHKTSINSLIFSLEPVSLQNERNSCWIDKQEEHPKVEFPKVSLPLVFFSSNHQFWIMDYLKGNFKLFCLDFQCSSVDKNLPQTEILSNKHHSLWRLSDFQKTKKSFSNESLKVDLTTKKYFEEKSEWPLDFLLSNLEDGDDKDNTKIDLNDNDSKRKLDVQLNSDLSSINNDSLIKLFNQNVITVISFLHPWKCLHCGKRFLNFSNLEKHLELHASKLPFRCKFCNKTFTNFGALSRHKILIHIPQNGKSFISGYRNKKQGSKNESDLAGLHQNVGFCFDQMKTRSAFDVNLSAINTNCLADLVNKVLGSKTTAEFSDSPFKRRVTEESTMSSKTVDNHSRLSQSQTTEINLKQQPFQSQEGKQNDCILENFQPDNKESEVEIKFIRSELLNNPTQNVFAKDNFATDAGEKNQDEDGLLNNSRAIYKKSTNVERKRDISSQGCFQQELDENAKTFLSQLTCQAKTLEVNSERKLVKETLVNSLVGNNLILATNRDSTNKIQETHFKEAAPVECIFIPDDPEDDSTVFSVSSNSSLCLSKQNKKADITNEIIILSDEENEDIIKVKMKDIGTESSSNKFCNKPDEVLLIKNQADNQQNVWKDVYDSIDISLIKNREINLPDKLTLNLTDSLQMITRVSSSTSSSHISNLATDSSEMVDFKKTCTSSSKMHQCMYCAKICSNSSNLKEHERRHTGERPFSCSVCHKTFAQKSTLSKHKQIHSRFKAISTSSNPASYFDLNSTELNKSRNSFKSTVKLVDSFTNQLKINHISNDSMNPESVATELIPNWDAHMINTNIQDNLIDSKSDGLIKPLTNIERDQPDIMQSPKTLNNPLSCPSYSTPSSSINPLSQSSTSNFTPKSVFTKTNPIKVHTSAVARKISACSKPYSCDMCDRTFTTSGNLKEHRRTHTGERPFECPFCEKTFAQASTRSRHVKIHSLRFGK